MRRQGIAQKVMDRVAWAFAEGDATDRLDAVIQYLALHGLHGVEGIARQVANERKGNAQ